MTIKQFLTANWPALVAARNDSELVRVANLVGDDDVTEATVTKGRFVSYLTPMIALLPTKSADIQAKWDRALRMVSCCDNGVILSEVAPLLAMAVDDGVLLQSHVDAVGVRKGSKAEKEYGADTVLTLEQISNALNG